MPLRLHRSLSPTLNEKLVRSYAEEAARLRDLAVNVTTARLRTRLLEEADNQDRLALAARRGIVQPHPIAPMDGNYRRTNLRSGLPKFGETFCLMSKFGRGYWLWRSLGVHGLVRHTASIDRLVRMSAAVQVFLCDRLGQSRQHIDLSFIGIELLNFVLMPPRGLTLDSN
jgi:hypothetical protein